MSGANREVMMGLVLEVLRRAFPDLEATETAVNCHNLSDPVVREDTPNSAWEPPPADSVAERLAVQACESVHGQNG